MVEVGKAILPLTCPAGGTNCAGTIKLIATIKSGRARGRVATKRAKRTRKIVIGKSHYRVAAGAKAKVRIKLTRQGKALLHQAGKRGLKVRVGGSGVKDRKLVLRVAGKRHVHRPRHR